MKQYSRTAGIITTLISPALFSSTLISANSWQLDSSDQFWSQSCDYFITDVGSHLGMVSYLKHNIRLCFERGCNGEFHRHSFVVLGGGEGILLWRSVGELR